MRTSHAVRIRIGVIAGLRDLNSIHQDVPGFTVRDELIWEAWNRTFYHQSVTASDKGWRPNGIAGTSRPDKAVK